MRLVSSSANLLPAPSPTSPGRSGFRNSPPSPSIIRDNHHPPESPSILRGDKEANPIIREGENYQRPNRPPLPRHLRGLQRLSVAVQDLPIWRRKEREGGEDSPPIIRGGENAGGGEREGENQQQRSNFPRHLRGLQRLSVAVQVDY